MQDVVDLDCGELSCHRDGQQRGHSIYCSTRCARCVSWLAPLAAMFAREPPSSLDPTKLLVNELAFVSSRLLVSSCRSAARTSGARIAVCSRRLRRRPGTKG